MPTVPDVEEVQARQVEPRMAPRSRFQLQRTATSAPNAHLPEFTQKRLPSPTLGMRLVAWIRARRSKDLTGWGSVAGLLAEDTRAASEIQRAFSVLLDRVMVDRTLLLDRLRLERKVTLPRIEVLTQ